MSTIVAIAGQRVARQESPDTPEQVAKKLGGNVDKLEKKLLDAYGNEKLSEQAIKKLEMEYKRATMALEGFMQLMRNKHELLMRGIQNLSLR